MFDSSIGIADEIFVPNIGSGVSALSGGGLGSIFNFGSAAGGGFLIYPNKSNTNTMQFVYNK